jgi:hypothetical protein
MISIYAAANLLMAGIWVVFMPSYIALAKCNKREDCEPNFWMSAGMLVEYLWYPGTVRIAGYGAKAANRYMPDSDQNILRPACIPCPTIYAIDTGGPFNKTGPMQPTGVSGRALTSTVDKATRAKCVRVPGLTLDPSRPFHLTGDRGDPVSPKEYVWTQLFGKEWQAVESMLIDSTKTDLMGKVDLYALRKGWPGKTQVPYNKSLFKHGTPFPWLRMQWTTVYADPVAKTGGREMPYDYTVDGYYVVNGVPFCPPKLWHFWNRPYPVENKGINGQSKFIPKYTPNNAIGGYDTVLSSQPVGPDAQPFLPSICLPSEDMISTCNKSNLGWYDAPKGGRAQAGYAGELEWWYPNLPYTSIFAWEDKHYMDYIERFFAGGHATICYWVPL